MLNHAGARRTPHQQWASVEKLLGYFFLVQTVKASALTVMFQALSRAPHDKVVSR